MLSKLKILSRLPRPQFKAQKSFSSIPEIDNNIQFTEEPAEEIFKEDNNDSIEDSLFTFDSSSISNSSDKNTPISIQSFDHLVELIKSSANFMETVNYPLILQAFAVHLRHASRSDIEKFFSNSDFIDLTRKIFQEILVNGDDLVLIDALLVFNIFKRKSSRWKELFNSQDNWTNRVWDQIRINIEKNVYGARILIKIMVCTLGTPKVRVFKFAMKSLVDSFETVGNITNLEDFHLVKLFHAIEQMPGITALNSLMICQIVLKAGRFDSLSPCHLFTILKSVIFIDMFAKNSTGLLINHLISLLRQVKPVNFTDDRDVHSLLDLFCTIEARENLSYFVQLFSSVLESFIRNKTHIENTVIFRKILHLMYLLETGMVRFKGVVTLKPILFEFFSNTPFSSEQAPEKFEYLFSDFNMFLMSETKDSVLSAFEPVILNYLIFCNKSKVPTCLFQFLNSSRIFHQLTLMENWNLKEDWQLSIFLISLENDIPSNLNINEFSIKKLAYYNTFLKTKITKKETLLKLIENGFDFTKFQDVILISFRTFFDEQKDADLIEAHFKRRGDTLTYIFVPSIISKINITRSFLDKFISVLFENDNFSNRTVLVLLSRFFMNSLSLKAFLYNGNFGDIKSIVETTESLITKLANCNFNTNVVYFFYGFIRICLFPIRTFPKIMDLINLIFRNIQLRFPKENFIEKIITFSLCGTPLSEEFITFDILKFEPITKKVILLFWYPHLRQKVKEYDTNSTNNFDFYLKKTLQSRGIESFFLKTIFSITEPSQLVLVLKSINNLDLNTLHLPVLRFYLALVFENRFLDKNPFEKWELLFSDFKIISHDDLLFFIYFLDNHINPKKLDLKAKNSILRVFKTAKSIPKTLQCIDQVYFFKFLQKFFIMSKDLATELIRIQSEILNPTGVFRFLIQCGGLNEDLFQKSLLHFYNNSNKFFNSSLDFMIYAIGNQLKDANQIVTNLLKVDYKNNVSKIDASTIKIFRKYLQNAHPNLLPIYEKIVLKNWQNNNKINSHTLSLAEFYKLNENEYEYVGKKYYDLPIFRMKNSHVLFMENCAFSPQKNMLIKFYKIVFEKIAKEQKLIVIEVHNLYYKTHSELKEELIKNKMQLLF